MNPAVNRLSVDKKQISFFAVPPIPPMPDILARSSPDLYRWSQEFLKWRDTFNAYLKQQIQALAQSDEPEDDTALQARIDEINRLLTQFVRRSGDTMTGPFSLAGDPTLNLQAATKQYVDLFLRKDGGTMTGPLILSRNPIKSMEAATKTWVESLIYLLGQPYIFTQLSPASTWTINHNRSNYPGGLVVMTGVGNIQLEPNRADTSTDQVVLTFDANYDGRAVLTFS